MRIAYAFIALAAAASCGPGKDGHLADAGSGSGSPTAQIVISPATTTMMVTDGSAVSQAYTAMLVEPDGTASDVTSTVTWSLEDASYGSFAGATLSVAGGGAGPSELFASLPNTATQGSASFTVYVHGDRVEGTLPTDGSIPALFGSATETPAQAPSLVYPSDGILVPPNLGQFDVHWSDAAGNTVWEVSMSNEYIDLHIYTQGLDPTLPSYTLFNPTEWYPIASTKTQLTLSVSGLQLASPATKGTAAPQHVDVTNENAKGGIYYWSTTSDNEGIFRYDVSTPNVPPAPFVTEDSFGHCVGCHALSRDGTKIAMTLDTGGGRGTVLNVADQSIVVPFDGTTQPSQYWNFATFNGDATKLVTLENGEMSLIDLTQSGALIEPIANSPDDPTNGPYYATHPEISPDNTQLVNVEGHSNGDFSYSGGGIVLRSYDGNVTFGAPHVLVAYDPAVDDNSYYPSFSPDGQWVVFTRPTQGGGSYNNGSAETWVVKTDGSLPPIRLDSADLGATLDLTNSWARWVPFGVTFGPTAEPLFYLTFSSARPFGVRIPGGGQPQIWMTPFFPQRAIAGTDPSGPAFRVPFQNVATTNHIAQWTQQVVPIQ